MQRVTNDPRSGAGIGGRVVAVERPALLDVNDVAKMLRCSPRTVCRLSDCGRIPHPVKLGALVRWRQEAMEEWISNGCPPCERKGSRRA